MIHFLAFYVKPLKKAHFKEFYSTKRSTFQNFYANRLKSKNFYSIKSALFRISMQMKIHLLYSWINLRGVNPAPPPPPPYRNNLYKITYVINFLRYSFKIRGGSTPPPLIYLPYVLGGGGGLRPPTLLLWRPWHMRIYQFIHLLYLFMYFFIRLFSYSFIHSFSMVFQSISVQIRCTCTCILQH